MVQSHRLTIYNQPPTGEILLNELEQLAEYRLALLQGIEDLLGRRLDADKFSEELGKLEAKYMPLHSGAATAGYSVEHERRRDVVSHFIARLGLCSTEQNQKWFLTMETALFRFRFQKLLQDETARFVQTFIPQIRELGSQERDSCKSLLECFGGCATGFYVAPFELALDLVSRRAVFLRDGWAHVSKKDLVHVAVNHFHNHLSQELVSTARALPRLWDGRLVPILSKLGKDHWVDPHPYASSNVVDAQSVDALSKYFPPCMRHLHQQLRKNSHLRYGGRMQYGLFLKSIGLTLEDAIVFWRKAFQKKSTEDQFQKNYLYYVRHNYGQEGRRISYSAYNCHRILSSNTPGPSDSHGCPFKQFEPENLAKYLESLQLPDKSPTDVQTIVDLARTRQYQAACTRLLELTLATPVTDTITHPHQFYEHCKNLALP